MRKIKTGYTVKDDKAMRILNSVIGQLSDGIWENSTAMEKYWMTTGIWHDGDDLIIETGDFGKSYEVIDGNCVKNGFGIYSDAEVLCWFATKIYQIAKEEVKDTYSAMPKKWYKNDDTELIYFGNGIFMKDAMEVRDSLRKLAKSMA